MTEPAPLRALLVGVRGHGGEEVYCTRLRDLPPAGVRYDATFDFHAGCAGARCNVPLEVALNRLVHPWAAPDQGFRVLRLGERFDLVHVHTHPTLLLGRRGAPVVFSAGSDHFHYLREYEGWSDARIATRYARARRVFGALGVIDSMLTPERITLAYTFSEWSRRAYLGQGVPPEKMRVLPPGIDVPVTLATRPHRPVTFLFMGRDARRKGGDVALAAFARVRESLPDARLVYLSDALPAPQTGVDAGPLVAPSEVGRVYASADVFLNPTRAEGFGLTNVEAQAHGLPVISTRINAIPEVVAHEETGLLVAPGDGDGLLSAMRRLCEDASLRADMGAAARARCLRLFALPVFQRGLRALYDEAVTLGARA